jgi:hypothetical protein
MPWFYQLSWGMLRKAMLAFFQPLFVLQGNQPSQL